jgi:hypothetical protein
MRRYLIPSFLIAIAVCTFELATFKPVDAGWQQQDASSEIETADGESAVESKSKRPAFFNAPTDFSKPPEVTPIDGPPPSEIIMSIDRGVGFLIATQNPDGSFGSHVSKRSGEIYAPLPGSHHAFRAATTSLAVSALLECKPDDPDAQAAVLAGQGWLFKKLRSVKRATGDTMYNVWSHAYAIQALVRLKKMDGQSQDNIQEIDDLIAHQIGMLQRYETINGGWGYYDFVAQGRRPTGASISFVSATVLIAFKEAEQVGAKIPAETAKKAYVSIEKQQKPDFTYLYGDYLKNVPMMGINRPGGSLGRSQACNLAMRMWGDKKITDNVLKSWLYRLYLRNGWLSIGRKRPIPHEAWMQVAGYFYYYGHYYAGMTIDQLKPEDRDEYRNLLASVIIKHQEPNGCWWDYTLYSYHQQYGTAFALMTMQRCLPESEQKRVVGGIDEKSQEIQNDK